MPILVNRFWFRIAPERTSAFVRPIFRMVLNQLDARIVVGPLEKHKAMVIISLSYFLARLLKMFRSRNT